jgi:hypothetical protein
MHRGSVFASGLAISTVLTGEPEGRARLLHLGRCDVFRVNDFLVAKFAEPTRLAAADAPGAVLVKYGRLLSMALLTPDEIIALETLEEAVVLVVGGAALRIPLNDGVREDMSNWLDVSRFVLDTGVQPLGEVVTVPRAAVSSAKDAREVMGLAPIEAQTNELIQALLKRKEAEEGAARAPSLLQELLALFSRGQRSGTAVAGYDPTVPQNAMARPPLLSRLKAATAQMLWSSRLASFLGRQHAKYLNQVMDMFDANDLDAALRHAIPLNADIEAASKGLPLWTPRARKNLTISQKGLASGTSLNLELSFFEMLRIRYRRAFERLSAAGEIEKAAFVLAELLNAAGEAVDFLERHRRFHLAAEIAEAKKLDAALVVKLWFLAGERGRAIRIARVTGAFSYAVLKLESFHKEEADALRLLWAKTLVSGGHYGAAVDAVLPVENTRHFIADWIERAIETGGVMGARMLARKVKLFPERFEEVRDRAEILLTAEDEEQKIAAVEYARELIKHPLSVEDRMLAHSAVRRFLQRDNEPLARDLLLVCGDPILRADARLPHLRGWPHENRTVALQDLDVPLEIHRCAADRGAIEIFDAAALPGGRMLVAAGETGVFLLSGDGRIQMRFAEPAHRLVISDQADRAILLARRGEIYRLSRLDIANRRVSTWCDGRFDVFAPDFDGLNWFVGREGAAYAIDATAKGWEHIWKVDEAEAVVRAIARSTMALSIKVDWPRRRAPNSEAWTYELPSLTLRRRQDTHSVNVDHVLHCVAPNGKLAGWQFSEDNTPFKLFSDSGWINLSHYDRTDEVSAPTIADKWFALQVSAVGGNRIHLFDCAAGRERARFHLEGAGERCHIRIHGERIVVCDGAGRILALSLTSGGIISEHRLTT